jgi:hypothetical protein
MRSWLAKKSHSVSLRNYETREAEVGNQNLSYTDFDKKSAFLTMTSADEAMHNPCTKPTTACLENLDESDA